MTRIILTTTSNLTAEQIRQFTQEIETQLFDLDGEPVDIRIQETESFSTGEFAYEEYRKTYGLITPWDKLSALAKEFWEGR